MTPAQLRAFASIVKNGTVKGAAAELGLSESGVSMHVAQLRKELGDELFVRTGPGLAFTPGGLRLASRAVEILGLQEQTVIEVGEAARGQRILRLGTSSLFAELAAPGLVELFTHRARDLEIELSVHAPERFESLLTARALDVAIGPGFRTGPPMTQRPFLAYDVHVVAAPDHPLARREASPEELRAATWLLGPAAIGRSGVISAMLAQLNVPEERQRIFQSEAAALDEAKRGEGLALAVVFATAADVTAGRLVHVPGPGHRRRGTWTATTLSHDTGSAAAELVHFLTTPRATRAMLQGSGVSVKHFRPSVYVTLWN